MRKIISDILFKFIKALIELEYRIDKERDCKIAIGLGTKYDDHDYSIHYHHY